MVIVKFKSNGVEDVRAFTISFFVDMWINEMKNNDPSFEVVSITKMPF